MLSVWTFFFFFSFLGLDSLCWPLHSGILFNAYCVKEPDLGM